MIFGDLTYVASYLRRTKSHVLEEIEERMGWSNYSNLSICGLSEEMDLYLSRDGHGVLEPTFLG